MMTTITHVLKTWYLVGLCFWYQEVSASWRKYGTEGELCFERSLQILVSSLLPIMDQGVSF